MREDESKCGTCGTYLKSILKFLVSHIGLVSLVVGYTIIGGVTFAKLEADHEVEVKQDMSTVREKVTDVLWDITNDMEYLDEYKWSEKARTTLKAFEKSLIKAIKQDGWDGIEADVPKQWTFTGALFYSIILITTIGYGHIAPKTPWGKVVTIFYAIPGVPLMMLCLANIGDGMAHSFRFLYWKVCCYACTKRPKRRRRPKSSTRVSRSSHHSGGSSGGSRAPRSSSFRRSARNSQRSADSQFSDSAFCSYSEHEYRHPEDGGDLGDGAHGSGGRHGGRGGERGPPPPRPGRDDTTGPRGSGKGQRSSDRSSNANRSSQNSKNSNDPREDEGRVAVLYNKYALDKDGLDERGESGGHLPLPQHRSSDRSNSSRDRYDGGRGRATGSDMAVVDHQPRMMRNQSPEDTPTMGRSMPRDPPSSSHYPQHLPPPHDSRMLPPRLDPPYIDYDDSDEYDETNEDDDPVDKPVPIWLGVMLVVAYILGGAVLFSGWEGWSFLDSVYFCFITLTTIGFGDFVPAQEKKNNPELSIALCSLYLLFGIALLAMSFNLVQEEVISNVKRVARRLGIIKEEDGEQIQD